MGQPSGYPHPFFFSGNIFTPFSSQIFTIRLFSSQILTVRLFSSQILTVRLFSSQIPTSQPFLLKFLQSGLFLLLHAEISLSSGVTVLSLGHSAVGVTQCGDVVGGHGAGVPRAVLRADRVSHRHPWWDYRSYWRNGIRGYVVSFLRTAQKKGETIFNFILKLVQLWIERTGAAGDWKNWCSCGLKALVQLWIESLSSAPPSTLLIGWKEKQANFRLVNQSTNQWRFVYFGAGLGRGYSDLLRFFGMLRIISLVRFFEFSTWKAILCITSYHFANHEECWWHGRFLEIIQLPEAGLQSINRLMPHRLAWPEDTGKRRDFSVRYFVI